MLRVIILTQYYPPETGAPQNRLHSLARFLRSKGCDVLVVSAMPNYPKNEVFHDYRGRFKVDENIDGVSVSRSWIYVSRSRSVVARLANYFSFVVSSFFRLLTVRRPDLVICESPPLFLGITAVVFSKLKRARL